MIEEFDRVRIKATGITGDVIDIYKNSEGQLVYTVEADERGVPGGYSYGDENDWQLFDCLIEEIEKIT